MAGQPDNLILERIAESLAGHKVGRLVHAGGGGNSRIYRVECDGRDFALKSYPPAGEDGRDRLGVECRALEFLARHGTRQIPGLIAADREAGFALLEWIEGESVTRIGREEVDCAISFINKIWGLNDAAGAKALPQASEACLTGAEVARQIQARIGKLRAVAELGEEALATFLQDEFDPAFAEILAWAKSGYAESGLDFTAPVKAFLIPADFGFHNALRSPERGIVFLDFEYFGWDDPVKLVADFLLHPARALGEPEKQRFCLSLLGEKEGGENEGRQAMFNRLRFLFPLFGLRWCAILLNEFLPGNWVRRRHAGQEEDWESAKAAQLARSRLLLRNLRSIYRDFPYGE